MLDLPRDEHSSGSSEAKAEEKAPVHPFQAWRESKPLTQEEMGEAIGCHQTQISRFESGQVARLQPEQAKAAAEVSGGFITTDHCLFDTPWARLRAAGLKPKKSRRARRAAKRSRKGARR